MSTTTLYLIRHAEAAHADEGADPGLSERGEQQAALVATRLRAALPGGEAGEILHGSRRRARQTAQILADALPGWRARHSADAEDRTPVPSDLSTMPERYHALLRGVPSAERDPEGRRLDAALESLAEVGDHDRALIMVTHAFVVAWFVRAVLEAPTWRWVSLPISNASLTVLRWHTGVEPRVLGLNDTGHLHAPS